MQTATRPPKSKIRTLAVLLPSETREGKPILRGNLGKDLISIDCEGNQRKYPAGCELVLKKNRGSYSLLVIVPEVSPAEQAEDFEAARADAHSESYACPF